MFEKQVGQIKRPTRPGLNAESIKELWSKTCSAEGKPDWSYKLSYYSDNIYFKDSSQAIHGTEEFKATTERLTNPSNELKMNIANAEGKIFQQRDYCDLWGDIFYNMPRFGKVYRMSMIKNLVELSQTRELQ